MKILVTGQPKIGKSTLLASLVDGIENRNGFTTRELINEQQRVGFEVISSSGQSAVLAQTTDQTDIKVGSYYVDLPAFTNFLRTLSSVQQGQLLYVDEIGEMQLYCSEFISLVHNYLAAPNDFLASISKIYRNDLIDTILTRNDTLLFELSETNRPVVTLTLQQILQNREVYSRLDIKRQHLVTEYAKNYLNTNALISIGKLYTNGIPYYLENKVLAHGLGSYTVFGKNSAHHLQIYANGDWNCDCPLSRGVSPYNEKADCSHIQSIRLYEAK